MISRISNRLFDRSLVARLAAVGTLSLGLAAGCTAGVDDTEAAADESDIRAGALLGDVGAAKLPGSGVYIAGAKLTSVLENLGLEPGAKKPKEGELRCMPRYTIELYKPNGDALATAAFDCDGEATSDIPGTLKIAGGKSYLIKSKSLDEIKKIGAKPSTVGEILFGANAAKVGRPGAGSTPISGDGMAKLMRAFDLDEVPDYASNPSTGQCPTGRVVSVSKRDQLIAQISVGCDDRGSSVPATLTSAKVPPGGRAVGVIHVDAAALLALEK